MSYENVKKQIIDILRVDPPVWLNLKVQDIEAVKDILAEVSIELAFTYDFVNPDLLLKLLTTDLTRYATDDEVDDGEVLDPEEEMMRYFAGLDVYVVPPPSCPKVNLNDHVFIMFTKNKQKRVISINANLSDEMRANIAEVVVPNLENLYIPRSLYRVYTSAMEDENEIKKNVLRKAGLEYITPVEPWRLGGWDIFKEDMKLFSDFKHSGTEEAHNISIKGVLMVGIPGTGKSLAAKVAGSYFNWPVVKFSMSAILSKWVGESERKFEEFKHIIEALAPVVLYIDELEKVLHTSQGDPVTPRIIGELLTWMQDTDKDIFVVATANAVFGSNATAPIPPELMRKGRFEEVYFADVPPDEERVEILDVFLRYYNAGITLNDVDIDKFIRASKQFTGAEIEDAVRKAVMKSVARGVDFQEALFEQLKETIPIAKQHAEYVANLRKMAAGRFRPVSTKQKNQIFSLKVESDKPEIHLKGEK